jgi:hypothetical protein
MFFVDNLGRLGHIKVQCAIWRLQNGASLEAVRVAGGLACHNDIALPGGQDGLWPGILPNEEEIPLTNMRLHREAILSWPSPPRRDT